MCVSVDFGRNANAVVIGCPYSDPPILADARVDALGTVSSAKDAGEAMRRVFHAMPDAGIFLLEEQSKINSETPMMESALSAIAAEARPGTLVVHVPVSRVKSEFGLPTGRTEKKKVATRIAEKFLAPAKFPAHIIVAPEVRTKMDQLSRKHDLADALLQMMWFARTGKKEIARPKIGDLRSRVVRATDPRLKAAEEKRTEKRISQKRRAEKMLTKVKKVRSKRKKIGDARDVDKPKQKKRSADEEREEEDRRRPLQKRRKLSSQSVSTDATASTKS